MTLKNILAQKLISCLLIIAILSPAGFVLFSIPQKTNAYLGVADLTIVNDPVDSVPTLLMTIRDVVRAVLKALLEKIARNLLDKMTQSTVNWINNGFQGKPLFLEQPGNFVKDIVKGELKGIPVLRHAAADGNARCAVVHPKAQALHLAIRVKHHPAEVRFGRHVQHFLLPVERVGVERPVAHGEGIPSRPLRWRMNDGIFNADDRHRALADRAKSHGQVIDVHPGKCCG